MKSVYLKNFSATVSLVFICFALVAFSFVGIGRYFLVQDFIREIADSADEVAHSAQAISTHDSLDSWLLAMNISSVSKATGTQILIADSSGVIIRCSEDMHECRHINQQLDAVELSRLGRIMPACKSSLSGVFPIPRYLAVRQILSTRDGGLNGYVITSNRLDDFLGAWSTFLAIAAAVSLSVLLVSVGVSLAYSKHMARPLDEMAAASRKFARGDFSVRVKQVDDPTDEMGALIESFNSMADALESSEKHRSEFIANISHELRTPMTTIAGFADGILDGTIPPEDERKYLVSIRDETKRLSRLVRDMLDVSQTESRSADQTKWKVFDLTELVLQTLLSFETRATKKNLDVEPLLPENHLMVRANKDSITQVIYNLLDNAVKFAAPGSCITLRLYKDGTKAYVSVLDRGETIPAEDLPFIFDRFHKSDRSRSLDKDGVGLGLYLVKAIINSHDEDIAVKSENGETEFVFTLTLAE